MRKKEVRQWKKVFESDLSYIVYELKELVTVPALVIVEGPMGAGKTTFIKNFISSEGDESFSPSYSVISDTATVVHADFYRVQSREEIIHLELPLYLEHKKYLMIEWGKKHFAGIVKELTEDFSHYLLEVSMNASDSDDESPSRNFTLFEIFED